MAASSLAHARLRRTGRRGPDHAAARLIAVTLAFAFSHRSYFLMMLLPEAILATGSPAPTFGGANLNFFPMGALGQRTGVNFHSAQHER